MVNRSIYDGWPSFEAFQVHITDFKPFIIRILEYGMSDQLSVHNMLHFNDVVDVSYLGASSDFSGDNLHREHVYLPLSKIAEGLLCIDGGGDHWLKDPSMSLYVSQATIYSRESKHPAELSSLLPHVKIPPYLTKSFGNGYTAHNNSNISSSQTNDSTALRPQDPRHAEVGVTQRTDKIGFLQEVNLWMNIQPVQSRPHYDGYHNLLQVTRGSKIVRITSPKHSSRLQPKAASAASPNHSHLSCDDYISFSNVTSRTNECTIDADAAGVWEFQLHAGDWVFIPEGFWHQVSSSACTAAVSFWFSSPLTAVLSSEDLAPYILRESLHQMVTAQMKAILRCLHIPSTSADLSSMTQDDFDAWLLVSTAPSTVRGTGDQGGSCVTTVGSALSTCSFADMKRLWPSFASRHPTRWVEVLLSLGPQEAHLLSSRWENENENNSKTFDTAEANTSCVDTDSKSIARGLEEPPLTALDAAFFSAIFEPCGEQASEVRKHLIRQTDVLRLRTAREILTSVLGFSLGESGSGSGSVEESGSSRKNSKKRKHDSDVPILDNTML